MSRLPTGTVTFLLTDIEGSTALWAERPAEMEIAVAAHDALIAGCVERHHGVLLRDRAEGDSTFSLFGSAVDAVLAAAEILAALSAGAPPIEQLRVRVGLHSGELETGHDGSRSPDASLCIRVRDAAHGGQALLSGVTADLCREWLPSGAHLRPLGAFRLGDGAQTVSLLELALPGIGGDSPSPRPAAAPDDPIPAELTSFVGRELELQQAVASLAAERLVTLTGIGGVGKTRLAIRAARELAGQQPDGVVWIDLATVDDASTVPSALARSLGLRDRQARDPIEAVAEWLRDRRCLIVLDNCEREAEACARLANVILSSCRGSRILATSREPLHLYGERVLAVPPLSLGDPGPPGLAPDGGTAPGSDAFRLFVDRVRLREPSFDPRGAEAALVGEICRRLEGIPLSIELVAAWAGVLSLRELSERTRTSLGVLTVSSLRTASARQRSLRAVVHWSYSSLTQVEALVFRRLSVFRGWFDIEAAAALCRDRLDDMSDLVDPFTRLCDKSLLVVDTGAETARYRLLEPLREFGSERLDEAGEAEAAWGRLLEHLVALAERAEVGLASDDAGPWRDRLDRAAADVAAALRWACRAGEHEAGLRLGGAVWRYWYGSGRLVEGRDLMRSLLDGAPSDIDPDLHAKALHACGTLATYLGEYRNARSLLERCVVLRKELGDTTGLAHALNNLGIVFSEMGDFETGRALYAQSLELKRTAGDRVGLARTLGNLSICLFVLGDLAGAREAATEAMATARSAGSGGLPVTALDVSANIAEVSGQPVTAERLYHQSLELARAHGWVEEVALCTRAIGNLRRVQGDFDGAAHWLDDSLRMEREIGSSRSMAQALTLLAELDLARRDGDAAKAHLEEALELLADEGRPGEVANVHHGLARALLLAGALGPAGAELAASLRLACAFHYRLYAVPMIETGARLAAARGEPRLALRLAGAATAARTALGIWLPPARQAAMAAVEQQARSELGDEAADAALREGEGIELDDACALAATKSGTPGCEQAGSPA